MWHFVRHSLVLTGAHSSGSRTATCTVPVDQGTFTEFDRIKIRAGQSIRADMPSLTWP
ncbi:hypothetical protein BDR05DRAFT_960162 [Suillus weaverae]|nr:hypothetical protein BDR05DRAFT_960162 [Suillus weaverae]